MKVMIFFCVILHDAYHLTHVSDDLLVSSSCSSLWRSLNVLSSDSLMRY